MMRGRPGTADITGLLLAAGRGRRMGTTKQLLPWPPRVDAAIQQMTVVASAFDTIAPFCRRMIVVIGHEADAVRTALGDRTFDIVYGDPDAEMIESVKAGLYRTLAEDTMTCVLLHPADHPQADAGTIRSLLAEHDARHDLIVMPEHRGKGGHPVLIPRSAMTDILESSDEGGLRAWWHRHPERCRRVEVDDPSCTADLDSPSAYAARSRRDTP